MLGLRTASVQARSNNFGSMGLPGSVAEKVERTPQMKKDLSPAGGPKPLRRTAARTFSLATKQRRFQVVEGRCEACGELIGDGADWRRAIYQTAWCCIRRVTTTQSGFYPDNLIRK